MIDFHTHILPGIDDGSRALAESVEMVEMLLKDGVKTVVATPHYFANKESPRAFCARRNAALEELSKALDGKEICILPGAEISYYPGISKMEDLHKLTIKGTSLLLLEMPFCPWTEYMVKELIEMSVFSDVQIVLAHIERYFSFQNKGIWKRLYENGVFMQTNGSFFLNPLTRRKAIRLLKEGKIHFIGSDCHNTSTRSPNLGSAFLYMEKKLGPDFLNQFKEYGNSVLFGN